MKIIRFLSGLSLISTLVLPSLIQGQTFVNTSFARRYNILIWDESKGSPANVMAMAQDSAGYLWIGSENGICRFDGVAFSSFTRQNVKELPEDDCSTILVSQNGSIYFGLFGGNLAMLKNEHFSTLGSKEIFKGKTIISLCEDGSGNIWILTDGGGLLKYNDSGFECIAAKEELPACALNAIANGSEHDVWLGSDEGLRRMKDGKIVNYTAGKSFPIHDAVTALLMDRDKNLWIGTAEGKLILYNKGKFVRSPYGQIQNSSKINVISEDSEGNLWIGTEGEGILIYQKAVRQFSKITTKEGLSADIVKCILQDHGGDMLVGTQGNGLNRFRKNILRTYTTADGLSENIVLSLFEGGDHTQWIGFQNGSINHYNKGKFENLSSIFDIGGFPVFSITEDKRNNIWVATIGKLIRYNGKKTSIFSPGIKLGNSLYHALYTSRDGTVWAGTDAGIYLIGEDKTTVLTKNNGLSDDRIFCFTEDHSGRMWIGTQEGGINIYDHGKITRISATDGLSDNLILAIYEDAEGAIWVGTGHNGLNRIDGKTGKIDFLGNVLGAPRMITFITEDPQGNLWFGTEEGIVAAGRKDLESFAMGKTKSVKIMKFGIPEGMMNEVCMGGVFPAGCKSPEGLIWIPTIAGITVIDPANSVIPSSFSTAFVEELILNNKSYGKSNSYILPAGGIHTEIKYSAPGFISPEKLIFRYKLEKYDHEWIQAGTRRIAYYTKLPPGNYTFRLQVCNHQGIWNEKETTIKIQVKPFFYQTAWFIISCILLVIILFYLFLKYRIRQVREKELELLVVARTEEIRKLNDELEQKVVDRTAQLLASNTELEAFSYSVSHDLKAPVRRIEGLILALNEDYAGKLDETGRDYLNKISESVGNMGQLIDELLKLSRIARQELERMEVNLSGMVQRICEQLQKSNPQLQVDLKIQKGLIIEGDARLLQIALQNLLDNAWKYSGKNQAARIEFGSVQKEGKTVLFVRDNGIGFDMGHYNKLFTPFQRLHSDDQFSGTGIGLATVKRIVIKHGGSIWAESEPGKGSTFFFTL